MREEMGAGIVIGLALLGPPSVGGRLELQWSTVGGCPDEAAIRDAVDRYLGREEFGPTVDDVIAAGTITSAGARYRLAVYVRLPGATIERTIETPRCEELADAAGLIIAVALDPLRTSRAVTTASPITMVPPQRAPPRPAPTARAPRSRVEVRVGAAGEVGTLPGFSGGVRAAAAVVGRRYRVEISGQYLAPRIVHPVATEPTVGAVLQLGSAALRGCFLPRLGAVELPNCVGAEAGAMRGDGVGLATIRRSHRPWLALVAGQEVAWTSRRRVGLWLGVDALLNLIRPRFVVGGIGTVYQGARAGFRVAAGPTLRW